jgi:rRNA maturation endonuclease Nob1
MVILSQGPAKEVTGHYRRCLACNELFPWKLKACKYCGTPVNGLNDDA